MNKKIAAQISLAALLVVLTRAEEAQAQKIKERLEKKQLTDGARLKTAAEDGAVRHKRQRRRRGRMRSRADLYEPLIIAAAARYGVDPRTLWTVVYLQTRFRADVLTQLGGGNSGARFGERRFGRRASPVITGAARRLKRLAERYDDRLELVLASYHSGERAVDAYLHGVALRLPNGTLVNRRERRTDDGVPPFRDTRRYVARGLAIVARVERAAVFDARDESGEKAVRGGRPRRHSPGSSAAWPPTSGKPVFYDVHSGERFLVNEARGELDESIFNARLEAPQRAMIREGLNPTARVRETLELERRFAAPQQQQQRPRFALR